jgi:hypothetical protein
MSYRKDDVTFHAENWRGGHTAVNVKVRFPYEWEPLFVEAAKDADEEPDRVLRWYAELEEAGDIPEWAFESACEQGFEQAQTDAEDIFGKGVKVWTEGRSGGWLVVDFDEDDVAGWDAVALAKWRKFERLARDLADYVPNEMAMVLVLNTYQVWKEDEDRRILA